MDQKILVTGGAGYIGSHVASLLARSGHEVIVLDNLSNGCANATHERRLMVGDVCDPELVHSLFEEYRFYAVFHFAGLIEVGDSWRKPLDFYENNVCGTANLLRECAHTGTGKFIFSSSAAVYGTPSTASIVEETPTSPINPYGRTKATVEAMLSDLANAWPDFGYIALRYFNAAGATPEEGLGENHEPETHLIPSALRAAAGVTGPLTLYGTDYPTKDGTPIRDYIHVRDLAQAHVLALQYLEDDGVSGAFNCGYGSGHSVSQVIQAVEEVTGREVPRVLGARRPGDPAVLVADGQKAQNQLQWRPQRYDLHEMVADAWRWEQRRLGIDI